MIHPQENHGIWADLGTCQITSEARCCLTRETSQEGRTGGRFADSQEEARNNKLARSEQQARLPSSQQEASQLATGEQQGRNKARKKRE